MSLGRQAGSAYSHLQTNVADALRETKIRLRETTPSAPLKVHMLRNYSAEFIEPFLAYYFAEASIGCEISFGGYDMVQQDIGGGDFADYRLVVVSLLLETLRPDWDEPSISSSDLFSSVTSMLDPLLDRAAVPLVLNTFIAPIFDPVGTPLSVSETAARHKVHDLNQRLRTYVGSKPSRCFLVDWERIVMMLGAEAAIDRRMGYMAAAPFRHSFLSAYAYDIFRIGRAVSGGAKKCLIVDCDNTLWGGVIGEAGIDGIELDRSSYPGKAYYDFQRGILRLVNQGVMLALCTKNNLDDVMMVLERHPHCLVQRRHLVSFRVNWEDKEKNIEEIVEEIGVGMDAVVFVDDSDVECERVKSFLPEITVLPVPKQIYNLPLLLDRDGLFDKLATTAEDRRRVELYQTEARRRETARTFATTEAFLATLALTAKIERASATRVARIAQLTQKTNQFNLTTRRYSEGDIARLLDDQNCAIYSLSASDKFGELGLVGVLIARLSEADAHIDTLLMSCRVLGRRLEYEFVAHCIEQIDRSWRPLRWRAEYIPTRKNQQVARFWTAFGFEPETSGDGPVSYAAEPLKLKLVHYPFIKVEGCEVS